MRKKKEIIAILGSTRQGSANLNLLNAIIKLYSKALDIRIFKGLQDIPHFNSDLDTENPPEKVIDFRRQLKEADGILICTPEYAMGVPGTLKNAIDWTVSSMEFSHKPVALITASSAGQDGHLSLMKTLKIIEANIPDGSQLLISFIKTKLRAEEIIDTGTLRQLKMLIESFILTMDKSQTLNKAL